MPGVVGDVGEAALIVVLTAHVIFTRCRTLPISLCDVAGITVHGEGYQLDRQPDGLRPSRVAARIAAVFLGHYGVQSGYAVNARDAVNLLQATDPAAAAW